MSQYNNYGQAGSFGDRASSKDFTMAQTGPNVQISPQDLRDFYGKLINSADAAEHTEQIDLVQNAVEAIENGDEGSARRDLRSAGRWVLEKASDLGFQVLSQVIKHELGIS